MLQTAIVSGGSRGIGKALALQLASVGVHVRIIGRDEQALGEVSQQVPDLIEPVVADLADTEVLPGVIEEFRQRGSVDFLVHNAATELPLAPLANVSLPDWEHTFRVNLGAPVMLTQGLLSNLRGGKVLFVNTGAAFQPVSGALTYCATKAALNMVCCGWQMENPDIAFAQVFPGMVDTDMQARLRCTSPEVLPLVNTFRHLHEQKGLISPEMAASFMGWLLTQLGPQEFAGTVWDIDNEVHRQRWQQEAYNVAT